MDFLRSFILGLVQGLTEFLPVSSSGHLAASRLLFDRLGLTSSALAPPLVFDLLLHLGTLVAVIVFFRKDVAAALLGAGHALVAAPSGRLREVLAKDDGANLALAVLVGTIPTGIIGLALAGPSAAIGDSGLRLGLAFLACALILATTKFVPLGKKRLDLRIALLVGVVQGIAVLPGVSRSGATIAAALALGLAPQIAAKYSFLLSLPAIIGASLLEIDLDAMAGQGLALPYLVGVVTATLFGLLALKLLVLIVDRGKMWAFAPYVALVGFATMIFL